MYDRTIKMYDEAHSPKSLEEMSKNKNANSGKFLTEAHFFSYFMQMKKIKELNVKSVCEIGPGENFIQQYMKTLGLVYDTMDIISESNPTYLSKLEDFDTKELTQIYDLVGSFQMLEHSSYENFQHNIKKMMEMTNKYIYISLPYSCNKFSFGFNFQFGQNRRFHKKIEFIFSSNKNNRKYRKEYMKEFPWAVHYFEIGRKGFSKNKVLDDIRECGLNILETFHSENVYHYFILAEKRLEKS